jgi:hypothetical protein
MSRPWLVTHDELDPMGELRIMARVNGDFIEMYRMPKLDWSQREPVRATLRRNARRLLAKNGYPPYAER